MRALLALLSPRRWRSQYVEARRLLASKEPPPRGAGEKIDAWLDAPAWEVRNLAVKLIAHYRDEERYLSLLEKLLDSSEVGIVRRNAAEALRRVGLDDLVARSALLEALGDAYWEVRAEAGRSLAALFPPAEEFEAALLGRLYRHARNGRRRLREENFEVRMAIAEGLGHLGVGRPAFDALAELARDDSWPVRSQAAVALAHFAARRPDFHAEARRQLLALDRQSEGAVSYFVHREVLSHALRAIHRGPGAIEPSEVRPHYLNPKVGWNHIRR